MTRGPNATERTCESCQNAFWDSGRSRRKCPTCRRL